MATRKTTLDHLDRFAQKALNDLYKRSPKNERKAGRQSLHSWTWVGEQVGFNFGYVYRVASGEKKASNRLLIKLGLPARDITIKAKPCPHCGEAKLVKRCPCKRKASTGPRRVYRDYPVWAMREISELVTAQPEARVIVLGVGFDYENVKVGYKP